VRGKKRDTGGGVPTRGDLSGRVWPRECAKERQGGKEQVPKLDEIASDIYKNICVYIYMHIMSIRRPANVNARSGISLPGYKIEIGTY